MMASNATAAESIYDNVKNYIPHVDNIYQTLIREQELYPFIEDGKNNSKADELRKAGKVLLGKKKYVEAIGKLTLSIMKAETDSISIAYAYAYRAYATCQLGYHRESLNDSDKAFQICPEPTIDMNNDDDMLSKVSTLIQVSRDCYLSKNIMSDKSVPESAIPDRNSFIEAASSSVETWNDIYFGTYICASRSIRMGEIIAVEKPYSLVLSPQTGIHCYHCAKLCLNLRPCETCTVASFCSVSCKEDCWNKYHRFECAIAFSLQSAHAPYYLVVKIALSIHNYDDSINVNPKAEPDRTYRSDRYKELLNLSTNYTEQINERNLSLTATFAARVYHLVRDHTNFFNTIQHERKSDIFKGLLLKLLFIHHINSNIIEKPEYLATGGEAGLIKWNGIYLFHSLFNHACNPNISTAYHGTTLVIRASRNIEIGEQLFDAYDECTYYSLPKSIRQDYLKFSYYFTCECGACVRNWPLGDDYVHRHCNRFISKNLETIKKMLDDQWNVRGILKLLFTKLLGMANSELSIPSREYYLSAYCFEVCHRALANKNILYVDGRFNESNANNKDIES